MSLTCSVFGSTFGSVFYYEIGWVYINGAELLENLPDVKAYKNTPLVVGGACIEERKGRDSNPRWSCPHTSFQDWRLKPLGHLSQTYLIYSILLIFITPLKADFERCLVRSGESTLKRRCLGAVCLTRFIAAAV